MQKITPFLWFDGRAEEAATFYTSIFEDSGIVETMRRSDAGPGQKGGVMSVTFRLAGQTYIALNGGPHFTFSPALSLFVTCETQDEVDGFWEKLSAGGEPQRCGWLKDKFGVSWQIVPRALGAMLGDEDPLRSKRVFDALMTMGKLDIAGLRKAFDQGG